MIIPQYMDQFKTDKEYMKVLRAINLKNYSINVQTIDESVPFFVSTIIEDINKPILIICPTGNHALRLQENISAWNDREIIRFPESESLPYERLITDYSTSRNRIEALVKISTSTGKPPVVITSVAAICQNTIDIASFNKSFQLIELGDEIIIRELLNRLVDLGYTHEKTVYSHGQFSRKGGIIDIFPVSYDQPFRIEFWGDQIDSIRKFDVDSQRSLEQIKSFKIYPALESLPLMISGDKTETMLSHIDLSNCTPQDTERINGQLDLLLEGQPMEELNLYSGFFNHGNLLDYFDKNSSMIMYRPSDIAINYMEIAERIQQLRITKETRGELPYNFPSNHTTWQTVENNLRTWKSEINILPWGATDLDYKENFTMPFSSAPNYHGDLNLCAKETKEFIKSGGKFLASTSYLSRLNEIFEQITQPNAKSTKNEMNNLSILPIKENQIGSGFVLNSMKNRLLVLTDAEIFGMVKQKRGMRNKASKRNAFFNAISNGDYVVHVEHGIARFIGTEKRIDESNESEYLVLQYAQGDKLYVPMTHLDRVTPYVAPMDQNPSLTRLGTQEWSRTKSKVEKSTREMAAELLNLYAERELSEGHAMLPDTKWQKQMEESLPYEETEDQIITLTEVKTDMESEKPMDRLICGDVGYGKTEIAIRAAFKAVMDNKQVAILVPTTVLAEQHFETFTNRLKSFPCKIVALSRFRSKQEQLTILDGLRKGQIDICIGTHRLVQQDVKFKDIGLIIIDEEQRFGVVHKEKLKQLRSQVDVLTLTATPIPRTLHMSLAGVRDMSTITTAPEERLPIKTYVSEFSDDLIREAILRELDRQGQTYFLHNKVSNIEYMSEYIRELVPSARVAIAHGQMSETELEKSMIAFSRGDIDVLICTTIIESGLDIPNAITLIINRADAFGLAQLYQLRGRIGRSSQRAYSYLLIPKSQALSETAERRLKAMLSATELGSGFKIAMKDLEIRGAGNILGSEQSGHIHAVGFELYTKLLAAAVEDLRSQESLDENDPKILVTQPQKVSVDLGIPAGIPQEYINDLTIRLSIYQKLTTIKNRDQCDDIEQELKDRFGPFPWQVANLIYVMRLKIISGLTGIEFIAKKNDKITIQFPYDLTQIKDALSKSIGQSWVIGNKQIRNNKNEDTINWQEELLSTIENIAGFQIEMSEKLKETNQL